MSIIQVEVEKVKAFRVSELLDCSFYMPNKYAQEKMREGTKVHEIVQRAFKKLVAEYEVSCTRGDIMITGHIDLYDPEKHIIIEIKPKSELKTRYFMQVNAYRELVKCMNGVDARAYIMWYDSRGLELEEAPRISVLDYLFELAGIIAEYGGMYVPSIHCILCARYDCEYRGMFMSTYKSRQEKLKGVKPSVTLMSFLSESEIDDGLWIDVDD